MSHRAAFWAGWAAACAALAGCGGGGGDGGGGGGPAPLAITVSIVADGVVGTAYSNTITATGGQAPRSFSISGSLPDGLALDTDTGTISGTPSGPAGESDFTVTVTDSDSPAQTDSQDFTLRIADPLTADAEDPPTAVVGDTYSHSLAVSGGIPPYSFAVELPAGLSVDAEGVISGTPSAGARTTAGTATVTDSGSPTQFAEFDLHLLVRLEVATTVLPDAIGGTQYDGRLEADGGLPELTWDKTGGTLPLGVAPDGSVIGFAPASCASADFTLDVSVTDSDSPAQSASRTGIALAIEPREIGLPVSSSPPVASIGEPFSFDIAVAPGRGALRILRSSPARCHPASRSTAFPATCRGRRRPAAPTRSPSKSPTTAARRIRARSRSSSAAPRRAATTRSAPRLPSATARLRPPSVRAGTRTPFSNRTRTTTKCGPTRRPRSPST